MPKLQTLLLLHRFGLALEAVDADSLLLIELPAVCSAAEQRWSPLRPRVAVASLAKFSTSASSQSNQAPSSSSSRQALEKRDVRRKNSHVLFLALEKRTPLAVPLTNAMRLTATADAMANAFRGHLGSVGLYWAKRLRRPSPSPLSAVPHRSLLLAAALASLLRRSVLTDCPWLLRMC